jgi:hypothetical protein
MIARIFHFPSSDIWEMDMQELEFWSDGLGQIGQWENPKNNI